MIKTNSVADFKNMYKAYYKNTRIALTEVVLVPFLALILNMMEHLAGIFLD